MVVCWASGVFTICGPSHGSQLNRSRGGGWRDTTRNQTTEKHDGPWTFMGQIRQLRVGSSHINDQPLIFAWLRLRLIYPHTYNPPRMYEYPLSLSEPLDIPNGGRTSGCRAKSPGPAADHRCGTRRDLRTPPGRYRNVTVIMVA